MEPVQNGAELSALGVVLVVKPRGGEIWTTGE